MLERYELGGSGLGIEQSCVKHALEHTIDYRICLVCVQCRRQFTPVESLLISVCSPLPTFFRHRRMSPDTDLCSAKPIVDLYFRS